MDTLSHLLRGNASEVLIAETRCFVFNSLLDREPVQLLEKRFGVFCSTRFKGEFGRGVLRLLEWFEDCVWIACQWGIAVV